MAKGNTRSRRRKDSQSVGFLYKRKFKWINFCVYCGDPAQCEDHVLPLSVASTIDFDHPRMMEVMEQGLNIVPSCTNCNSIASDKRFFNIRKKRKYIQDRLREKHADLLRSIIWEDWEIEELEGNLRKMIEGQMLKRHKMELRVYHPSISLKNKR